MNNALCFPGMFRGALDCRARDINDAMKVAAAEAIAQAVIESDLCEECIIPSIFDRSVPNRVATRVRQAAIASGVARLSPV